MPGVCTAANEPIPVGSARKWENGQTIRVRFLSGDEPLQSKVRQHAREWLQYADLDMEFVENRPAHIRISFDNSTSWSYIGTECLDFFSTQRRPTMNLDPRDLQTEAGCRSAVLHEFGHALGCVHEHRRNPAGEAVRIQWNRDVVHGFYWREQSWAKETVDAHLKALSDSRSNARQSSAFEGRSIMMFPIPSGHARNVAADWSASLSSVDKSVISEMYPGRWSRKEDNVKQGGRIDKDSPPCQASTAFSAWARLGPLSENSKYFVRQHSGNDLVVQ